MAIDSTTFAENLTYQAQAPIPVLVQDLETIAGLDQVAEAQQKKFNLLLGCSAVGAFVSLFLVSFGIGLLLLIISVGASIYFGYQGSKYGRLNVDNSRYKLANRLLLMLGRDLEPEGTIETRVIFSSATDKSKKVDTVPHPVRSGWKIDHYEDSWLQLRGRFSDGTRFLLTAKELNQTAYGWKRGSSGKSKYKSKTKSKGTELAVTLTYSHRKYGAIKVMEKTAVGAIRLPTGTRLKRLKLTEKGMFLQTIAAKDTTADKSALYQAITMMFLSLYQVLNLARMLSKSKQA